ncbi:MAG: ribosome recycling factor [Phycisphaerae bacterium]|nr:ribosome recycling factor [Phycisphaerae bacterium]
MPMDEIEFECEEKMDKVVDFFRSELRTVRTGRASTGLVDHLKIEVASYGSLMDLRELATISAPEPQLIVVKPFDPSTLKDIERGIEASNIGITPMSDGRIIRLPVPALSGERRQQLIQQIRKMAEAQRVAIRNARRDAKKLIDAEEKNGDLSEDDADRCRENVQELINKYEKEIDKLLDAKTEELKEI